MEKQPPTQSKLSAGGWRFLAAMPYLPAKSAIDLGSAAMVPFDDARMLALRHQAPAIEKLVGGFGGTRKHPECYSFLLKEPLTSLKNPWEAACDIRNIVAISSVSRGWQDTVPGPNCWGTLYSDYFDFYPSIPSENGEGLVVISPAVSSYSSASKFIGYVPPDFPTHTLLNKPNLDEDFIALLMPCWQKKHLDRKKQWELTALFRSIAFAYRAARMPKGCDNIVYDFGISISLWNAAFECLVRPVNAHSNKHLIFDLLQIRRWSSPSMNRKRKVKLGKKECRSLNFVQACYNSIRESRNDFLHGNSVSLKSIANRRKIKYATLNGIAPLIYQVAVEEFVLLNGFSERKPLNETMMGYFLKEKLEKAIKIFRSGKEE